MVVRSLTVAALLLIVACAPGTANQDNNSTTAPPATVTTTTTSTTVTASTSSTRPASGCGGGDFVDTGVVADVEQPGSDASGLGLLSWETDGTCESFGLDFETGEGAPATTPPSVSAEYLATGQILRVRLGLSDTVLADQLVETALVDRVYVVRSLDGGLFLDMHLAAPARARVTLSGPPAHVSIDLEPGSEPFAGTAAISDRTVLLSPVDEAVVGGQVEVSGYARTFEANVLVIATAGGQMVSQTNTTAADWSETWGEFQTSVTLPTGGVSLFVGEESPQDGRLAGVTVNLTVQ